MILNINGTTRYTTFFRRLIRKRIKVHLQIFSAISLGLLELRAVFGIQLGNYQAIYDIPH